MKRHILLAMLLIVIFANFSYSQCAQPSISAGGPTVFCQGGNVVLTSSISEAGDTFIWRRNGSVIAGATSSSYIANISGNYTVVLSNAGLSCVSSPSSAVTVTINSSANVNAGSDIIGCSISPNFSLNGTISGGIGGTWTTNGTGTIADPNSLSTTYTPSVNELSGANLTFTLTNAPNGCSSISDQMQLIINPLSVANFTYINSCSNQPVDFTNTSIGGNNYLWSFSDGTSSSQQNPSHTYPEAGSYSAKLKVSNVGCPSDSITKTIVFASSSVANAGTAKTICVKDSVQIGSSISSGTTFSWTSKPSGFTSNLPQPYVTPKTTTVYYLTVNSSSGCTNQDSVRVTVNTIPLFDPGSNVTMCKGLNIQIGQVFLGSQYTYSWMPVTGLSNNTVSNPYASPLTSTVYTVRITDTNTGCIRDTSVAIEVNSPTSKFTYESIGDNVVFTNTSLNGNSPIASYNWNFGDNSSLSNYSTDTNPSHQFYSYNKYNVRLLVTDANGCSDSSVASIKKSAASGIISLSNGQPLQNAKVYLLRLNKVDSTVTVIDSTVTSNTGAYTINTIDTLVYIRVIADQSVYPSQMPSYYDSSIVFQDTHPIYLTGNIVDTLNFKTIAGINPGGTGFMSGTFSIANLRLGTFRKAEVTGSNIRVFLIDNLNNNVVQTALTDASGYLQFSNLPLGKYEVWVDKPFINNSLAPVVTLDQTNSSQNNIKFVLHKTYLEITSGVTPTSVTTTLYNSINICPNPAKDVLHILFTGNHPGYFSCNLIDMTGKIVLGSEEGNDLNISSIGKGVYFVRIQTDNAIAYKKVFIE